MLEQFKAIQLIKSITRLMHSYMIWNNGLLTGCSSDIIHIIIKVIKFYRMPSNYERFDLEKLTIAPWTECSCPY